MNTYSNLSPAGVVPSDEKSVLESADLPKTMRVTSQVISPQIGDMIYVPSSTFLYRGRDDFQGGLARINRVQASQSLPITDINYWMVGIEGRPGVLSNWKLLMQQQDTLKEKFGNQMAYSDPDCRDEFNQPNADWKEVEW